MIIMALFVAGSTALLGVEKTPSDAWIQWSIGWTNGPEANDRMYKEKQISAGSWSADGGFDLIKNGRMLNEIGDQNGEAFQILGPATIQIGNRSGLTEYELRPGDEALCFRGSKGYGCAVSPAQGRTQPAQPSAHYSSP